MNSYEILGVKQGASRAEITMAYERKVTEIKRDVQNKNNAEAFIKLLDKAYNELIQETNNLTQQSIENTVIMNPVEINTYLNKVTSNSSGQATGDNIDTSKDKSYKSYKNRSGSSQNLKKSKTTSKSDIKQRDSKNKKEKQVRRKDKEDTIIVKALKIMLYPIILLLSMIITLCKLVSMVMWIVSKALIVGGIAIISIHCYQIYTGDTRNIKVFLFAAMIIVLAIILPYVINILPNLLEGINNKLKKFAYN